VHTREMKFAQSGPDVQRIAPNVRRNPSGPFSFSEIENAARAFSRHSDALRLI
jgi:hypothetical protein